MPIQVIVWQRHVGGPYALTRHGLAGIMVLDGDVCGKAYSGGLEQRNSFSVVEGYTYALYQCLEVNVFVHEYLKNTGVWHY